MNSFEHDSRVLKACQVSSELSGREPVLVAALGQTGLPVGEQINDLLTVWRPQLKSRNWPKNLLVQILKYIEWMYRILARMKSSDLTVIHAHSISALPVGVVLKWLTGAPLVYDAHELESETNGLGPLRSKLTRLTEGLWIRGADRTITVCDSIADWYVDNYQIERPAVIRNVPMRPAAPAKKSTVLRDNHDIPTDALLFVYQGGLAPGRGIAALLEVFAGLGDRRHLVMMGYGVLEDQVRAAASRSANIHFQPAVPPDQVLFYTASADIGLCLIENTCLSYYFSLPNKLFEYLLGGLPVLVNDMPEQRNIVDRFECGWVVPASLEQQIQLFESIDAQALETRKAGVARAARSFDWEDEAGRLRELYVAIEGDRVA